MGSFYIDEFHFCLDTTMLRYNRSFGGFFLRLRSDYSNFVQKVDIIEDCT